MCVLSDVRVSLQGSSRPGRPLITSHSSSKVPHKRAFTYPSLSCLRHSSHQHCSCEVEIFQKTPWTWRTLSGLYNAALNKVAWQSSRDLLTDGTTGGDPARAVDGVLSNTWPYCMKTSTNVGDDQANIFWTVDLGT